MKILIVDDNPMDISIINAAIQKIKGIETFFARDAGTAVQIAIRENPDLIILDVVMPSMDGIEVKSRLSRTLSTASIPVVFVTGGTDTSEKDCYRIGCIDYLTKPINMTKLIDIITKQSFVTKLEQLMNDNKQFAQRVCG